MSEEERTDIHKEIKKNRRSNWLVQGIVIIALGLIASHFWDAGATYLKDRPIRQAEDKKKELMAQTAICKIDTVIMFWKDHAHADHIRDSLDDSKWVANDVDKQQLNKKVDDMTAVFVETLNTVSSIQNRISNKNFLRDKDE